MQREWKFSVPLRRARTFLAEVRPFVEPIVYDRQRPIAYTKTTYLDSDDHRMLSRDRGSKRRRLRVREYAAGNPAQRPQLTGVRFLELKESRGNQRHKDRFPIDGSLIYDLIAAAVPRLVWAARIARDPGLQVLASDLLLPVHPAATTWYRRRSFMSRADRVRITLDTEISFFAPRHVAPDQPAPPSASWPGPPAIVEIKCSGQLPRWSERALTRLGRPSRVSKYELAAAALGIAAPIGLGYWRTDRCEQTPIPALEPGRAVAD